MFLASRTSILPKSANAENEIFYPFVGALPLKARPVGFLSEASFARQSHSFYPKRRSVRNKA